MSTPDPRAGGSAAASLREQRLARVIDREVAPVWHDRFARMLFRDLPATGGSCALDVHCGSGHTTAELLLRLDDDARVLALEPDPTLVGLARAKVRPEWRNRVYFKQGDFGDLASMPAHSYDLTLANLVLGEFPEAATPLAELARVTKPGGQVLATLACEGSWDEVEELFLEVLRDANLGDAVRRLHWVRQRRPTGSGLARTAEKLGLVAEDFVIEQERFELLFRSGREFLFAPVVEHGPLRLWKAVIGQHAKPQELFWRLKEAIDTYYAGHVLAVGIVAGLVRIRVPPSPESSLRNIPFATRWWQRYPALDALWKGKPRPLTAAVQALAPEEEIAFDIDFDEPGDVRSDDSMPITEAEQAAVLQALEHPLDAASAEEELDNLLDQVFEFGEASASATPQGSSAMSGLTAPAVAPVPGALRAPPPPPAAPSMPPLIPPPPVTGAAAPRRLPTLPPPPPKPKPTG